jgi:hypothetical protein
LDRGICVRVGYTSLSETHERQDASLGASHSPDDLLRLCSKSGRLSAMREMLAMSILQSSIGPPERRASAAVFIAHARQPQTDTQPYHLRHVRQKQTAEKTLTHPVANRRKIEAVKPHPGLRPDCSRIASLSHKAALLLRHSDSEDSSLPSSIGGSSRSPACISSLCSLYSSSTHSQLAWRWAQLLYCGS